jgi:DNA-binding response OmpR family regulator
MESQGIKPPAGRVLIADDDRSLLELLQDFLTSQGYEVAAVETGAQVLDAMPTFHPDAIVLDLVLPDLSGADVLAGLRQSGLTVPVILISGHQIIVRDGFFGVLRKPFSFRRLAEVVAAAVDHGRTSGA